MVKQKFLQGTLILSCAGLISKALGALYRIPLARLLGGEGMGLYQMAYPIYTSILAISTAGIPVAISILVAERLALKDYRGAKRIFTVSLSLLFFTGALCSLGLFLGADYLSREILKEPRAFYPIVSIAPAIFFIALVSAFRGFFQGHQEMIPTAVSQVVEQLVRVATVLIAAYLLLPYGLEYAASGATLGAVTGGMAALLIMIFLFVRYIYFQKEQDQPQNKTFFKQESFISLTIKIAKVGIPLSVGGLLMPIMQAIDAFIVPLRLQAAGLSIARATELFGQLTGMAGTLINLPTIISTSLAVSLVPAISGALAQRNKAQISKRIGAGIRLTLLTCLPAAAGLAVLAAPISILLYDVKEVGLPLLFLAPGVLFLGLYQTTAGILQGLNKTYIPVQNLFLGVLLKTALNYYLTGIPGVTIVGAAIGTVCGFFLAFFLNYLFIKRYIDFKLPLFRGIVLPIIATAVMAFTTYNFYNVLIVVVSNSIATLGSIILGASLYGLIIILLGGLAKEELEVLPGGQKVIGLLQKLHILR